LHATALNHSYPHCWRHKTPIIFRATSQWFISMERLHGAALDARLRVVQRPGLAADVDTPGDYIGFRGRKATGSAR